MPRRPLKLQGRSKRQPNPFNPRLSHLDRPPSLPIINLTGSISCQKNVWLILSVAVGLRCSDGIILGVERLLHSKLLVKGANKRIQSVDTHVGLATAGLLADGKHLAGRGRDEAYNFRDQYNAPVPINVSANETECKGWSADHQVLADRLSGYVQAYTCYGSVRPFGISSLLAGVDKTGPRLFCIEPSGVFYGYRATAVGKGKALAKTELEKVLGKEENGEVVPITVRQGVMEIARM